VVSIDRSHLKGEASRFSAEFKKYPLSYERPFKFPCHLVGPLAIDNIIAISDLNIHIQIDADPDPDIKDTDKDPDRNPNSDTDKDTGKDTDKDTDMDTDTDTDIKFSDFS
jgi:hypothetical protein